MCLNKQTNKINKYQNEKLDWNKLGAKMLRLIVF